MTWVKVEDTFPEHRKVVGLSDAALACWLRGLCYASRNLTDGVIPAAAIRLLGTQKAAVELVEARLWNNDIETGGWFISAYASHQRTRAQVEDDRERNRARAAKSRARHSEVTEPESETDIAPDESGAVDISCRRPDPLWDALMAACGVDSGDITRSARGAYNKAVKELRQLDASPDEIRVRADQYRLRWPHLSLTPTALVRHWAEFGPPLVAPAPALESKPGYYREWKGDQYSAAIDG